MRTHHTTFLIFILVHIVLFSCFNEPAPPSVEERHAVKKAFNAYKTAVLEHDGMLAVTYLSSNSIEYYDDIMEAVIYGTKETLQSLSSGDLMQVLVLRRLFTKEELLSFDGKNLYQTMVDRQLMQEKELAQITLGEVATKGRKAKGQAILEGQPSPIFFDFQKESTDWKLDITTTIIITTTMVEQEAKKAGLSVPEYLENVMQLSEEEERLIWTPLRAS